MDKWRRFVAIGCAGAMIVCVVLPLIPYLVRVAQFEAAKARWERNGGDSYTLIARQSCFCPYIGEYKLTVQNGKVIAVEPLSGILGTAQQPPNSPSPADVDHLTVEATFAQAEGAVRGGWQAPWFETVSVSYDPTYGYVTEMHTDANGVLSPFVGYLVMDAQYSYAARDLQLSH